MDLPAVLGDFRIGGLLGQGGSGMVYDAAWGPRRVALKVLHPALVSTGKERAQFLAEAARLQQIAHPSVVKVFAVGTLPDGRPYLAMERLEGETLARVLERGPLPAARALALFGQLSDAVAALHDQGLVHRDLKPENVFVVAGEHAVLLDFGIAKDLEAPPSTTTQEGRVRGTPAYMAPERFFGQPASIASDVYELALVLYGMLAGRLPWDQLADPEARLSPRSLRELVAVPEALDVEIRRALSTRAQNRPASARALHAAVVAAASDLAVASATVVTAQLRPGPGPTRPPGDPAATPDQPTPLAWAPTVNGVTGQKRSQGRWRAVVGVAAVLGIGAGGVAVWERARTSEAKAPALAAGSAAPKVAAVVPPAADAASGSDPWAGPSAGDSAPSSLPLVEPKLSVDAYRAEVAAAVARLPANTHFVLTAEMGELRAQPQIADVIAKLQKDARVELVAGMLPPCVRELIGDAEWIAVGAASAQDAQQGTIVLRGRWARHDVEACFGDRGKSHVTADHATMFAIGDTGWLDFIDDHTVYLALHSELPPEALHALVRAGQAPPPHVRDLVAKLPPERSIAIVLDGHGGDDLSKDFALPRGSDVFGWVRAEPAAGVALDLAADPHTAGGARAAIAKVRPQLDEAFGSAMTALTGKLFVLQDGTVVHVRGNLTSLTLGMLSSAL